MKFKDRLITEVLLSRLERIEANQHVLLERTKNMAQTLDEILADVTKETSDLDSIATLIVGLRQQVADALSGVTLPAPVQAKVDAIFAAAEANKAKIAAALAPPTP